MSRQVIDRSQLRRATLQRGKISSGRPFDWGYSFSDGSSSALDDDFAVPFPSDLYYYQLAYFSVFSSPAGFGVASIVVGGVTVFPWYNGDSVRWDKGKRDALIYEKGDVVEVHYVMPDTGRNSIRFVLGFWTTLK